MWNPSTCECQCDMWCKPGQYLDHKNCICKNKLIGRVIEECTNIINETIINNMVWTSIEDKINPGIKIKDYNKFRFNSDIDLPLNTIIEFRSLVINISCVMKKIMNIIQKFI